MKVDVGRIGTSCPYRLHFGKKERDLLERALDLHAQGSIGDLEYTHERVSLSQDEVKLIKHSNLTFVKKSADGICPSPFDAIYSDWVLGRGFGCSIMTTTSPLVPNQARNYTSIGFWMLMDWQWAQVLEKKGESPWTLGICISNP